MTPCTIVAITHPSDSTPRVGPPPPSPRLRRSPSRDRSSTCAGVCCFHRILARLPRRMENMQYAEELVKEFLVFRGFTSTLQSYESELSTEIGRNFQVDKILDLVFSVYIPKYQLDRLQGLFTFFKQCFTSPADAELFSALIKLELSVLRYYVVNALKSGRQDKVVEFFGANGNYLLQKREDWQAWFALLKISTEKNTIKCLKNDIKQLNNKLSELQALLEMKEAEISQLRRNNTGVDLGNMNVPNTSAADSSLEGQDMPGVFEESAASRSAAQVFDSQSSSSVKSSTRDEKLHKSFQISNAENEQILVTEDDFPEVKVDFQETFLGHNSSISCCRFSASGSNVASSSVDGTANGGIKAWNADAKRVVCDLSTSKDFPRPGSTIFDRTGFASLTTVLPLGEDPPAITSVCFNHNGKILAASATDGMIHMFDMSAGLQITGWPAHDSPVSSVLFGPAETSIFSLGSDGKIFEWSLHNQGQILWSRDCSSPESFNKRMHEISLDSDGKRLLVTSGLVRAPIYQVQGHESGLRTLAHSSSITSVDWHPTLPMYITGSADNSVRVTSIV
uniref:Anaphase-promoting complex subunit 4-like WD40 domain-containing protein n=1 Tax=Oryza meridionalis TaxID=40149 RepID=A0A0E0DPM1_9ORYZ